jgi:oligopeptide/dipeptide ABC transporter ATP-binding protein
MTANALEIENLTVDLVVDGELRRAVHEVSLEIPAGSALGLIGESGSGKSVTARAAARLLPRTAKVGGAIRLDGQDVLRMDRGTLRRTRNQSMAMIFQDPRAAINPVRRVGDFVTEALRTNLNVDAKDAASRALELLAAVGINEPERVLRLYPHELSGGMLQRVMIASVLAIEPHVILADEPTTALDVTRQAEIVRLLDSLRREHDMGMLFITHDIDLAAAICDRIAVMYAGSIVEVLSADRLREESRHPYTKALLQARPSIDVTVERLAAIPGRPLTGFEVPVGCNLQARCPYVEDQCRAEPQQLRTVGDGLVRCRRAEEIGAGTALPTEGVADDA